MLFWFSSVFVLNKNTPFPAFPEILPGVMRMSGAAAASQVPRASTAVPVLDAQAAELKAERLWGMADARKPVSMERKNGMPEVSLVFRTAVQPTAVDDESLVCVFSALLSRCLPASVGVCLSACLPAFF